MTSYGRPFRGGRNAPEHPIPRGWKTLILLAFVLGCIGAGGVVSLSFLVQILYDFLF